MNLIRFGRVRGHLRNRNNSVDDEKRLTRYRRRFFSRPERRQQQVRPAVIPGSSTRYRRRFSSRAGRRNRTGKIRKQTDSGYGFESDTDSVTSLSSLSSEEDEGGSQDLSVSERNRVVRKNALTFIPLIPKVVKFDKANESMNNVGISNSGSQLDPTPSVHGDVESEGEKGSHQLHVISRTPQLVVPAKKKDDICIDQNYKSAAIYTEKFRKKLFTGEKQKNRSNIVVQRRPTTRSSAASFFKFRVNYLIVYAAIMLADGLQGTHLYALYSGYGYTVANLYSIGFITGAITSPFTGPIVDRFGRKKSAMCYCIFEILINMTEQYENLTGLIISRMLGGITTSLLSSVFESWLATEHRRRGFDADSGGEEPRLNLVMRDSTIVSKLAAIASGYIAHYLAGKSGNSGPFAGAVFFTYIALVVVWFLWSENYGSTNGCDDTEHIDREANDEICVVEVMTFKEHMVGAFQTIIADSTISRIGLIEGLTEGALQTFVFLWSPALASFALNSPQTALGIGINSEPAYGLIFGWFMACGVVGGFAQPYIRNTDIISVGTRHFNNTMNRIIPVGKNTNEERGEDNAMQTGFLCSLCYLLTAFLFLIPYMVDANSTYAFSVSLAAFLFYELLVGIYLPCQGVIRSIFMPKESTCSVMTMLRVIVNVAVALGVISTNYVSFTSAFATLSLMMVVATVLQLSIILENRA